MRIPCSVPLSVALALLCPSHAAILRVNPAAGSPHDGSTWATGYLKVQDALNASAAGDEIWVKQGTYPENITLKVGVALYGGFAGNEALRDSRNSVTNATILDGSHAGSVVTVPANAPAATILDGFTIQNGIGSAPGGSYRYGGGIYMLDRASPTIRHNVITGNTAGGSSYSDVGYGGGIYCGDLGTPVIEDNSIHMNGAMHSGGVYVGRASATIRNNYFTYNTAKATAGAASFGPYSHAVVEFNVFTGNTAESAGGAVVCDQNTQPTLRSNLFYQNKCAYGQGGAIYCTLAGISTSPCLLYSNVLDGNQADIGAGISSDGSVNIVNNTIVNNAKSGATGSGDGLYFHNIRTAYNNIIKGNNTGIGYASGIAGTGADKLHASCVQGNGVDLGAGVPAIIGTNGNISADPQFEALAYNQYRLLATSPCVDAGDNTYPHEADFYGSPRVVNVVDIGAVEFGPTLVWSIQPGTARKGQAIPGVPTVALRDGHGNPYNASNVPVSVSLVSPTGVTDAHLAGTLTVATVNGSAAFPNLSVDRGANNYMLRAATAASTATVNSAAFDVTIPRVYVSPTGSDANEGGSWSSPRQTVQAAVDGADSNGGEVWVRRGTYLENVTIGRGVSLLGGFRGTETMADQSNPWRLETTLSPTSGAVVTVSPGTSRVTVDGFTLTGGTGKPITALPLGTYRLGGGVYAKDANVVISRCRIVGNSATGGGGLHLQNGTARVLSCIVQDNTASSTTNVPGGGGGIDLASGEAYQILNCLITGNRAIGHSSGANLDARGGGLFLASSNALVRNNTIADNSALGGGGAAFLYAADPDIRNTVLAFNSTGVRCENGAYPIWHNNDFFSNGAYAVSGSVEGSPVGKLGNTDTDPLFVARGSGDYHVCSTSPCLNTGSATGIPIDETDLMGDARMAGIVDMGAYEFEPYWTAEALTALRCAAGLSTISASTFARYNVCGEAGLSVGSATRILRKCAGLEPNP